LKNQSGSSSSSTLSQSRRTRSRSLDRSPSTATFNAPVQHGTLSWLKTRPSKRPTSKENEAVSVFMEKYVIYPCTASSTPGFLEHLPCLFQEANVDGRCALRYAVQAASFADMSRTDASETLVQRALEYYGLALGALGESLAEKGKVPDDYDLMTVVILDIFEAGQLFP
jgi:hypothetical protein